jgi:NAD(P)-dependent dehydrogenase (short-subunit alcohol dehydrogenase family)
VSIAVVTGASSGIGAAIADQLRAEHKVITIDLQSADVSCDLGTDTGRLHALDRVHDMSDVTIDVLVCAAGVGPTNRLPSRLASVNFFGTRAMLSGLRPMLRRSPHPAALAVSSNTVTCHPNPVPEHLVRACLEFDEHTAGALLDDELNERAEVAYPVSKIALSRWVRVQAVREEWIGRGIRLNALVPGMTDTPMLAERVTDPDLRAAAQDSRVPVGRAARAEEVAVVASFLVSSAARLFCGSLVFCDGGTDALLNPAAPHPLIAAD